MTNPNQATQGHSSPDLLDRILVNEDRLLPSSGFTASVMSAIEDRSIQPQPIPFPWKIVAPGAIALLLSLAFVIRLALSVTKSAASADFLPLAHWHFSVDPALTAQVGPILLALAASWLCTSLCRKFAVGWSSR
jgi:hypothetical protein